MKGTLTSVAATFICPSCTLPRQIVSTSGHLADTDLEIVHEFKYLGDVLSCTGDVETAVRNRLKATWNNWHILASTMMRRDIPLKLRLSLYQSVIRPCMLYGAESWPMTQSIEQQIRRTDLKMLRWIHRVNPSDRVSSRDILSRAGLCDISKLLRQHRLRWFGHVKRSSDRLLQQIMALQVEGKKPKGRPRKTWMQTLQDDLKELDLVENDALDRVKWFNRIKVQPP